MGKKSNPTTFLCPLEKNYILKVGTAGLEIKDPEKLVPK